MIDLHCHILPALDDGAKTIEDAVAMARLAARDGIETIVATPHLFRGHSVNGDLSAIERKSAELRQALQENKVSMEILTGSEVHISHNLIHEIRWNRDQLVINRSSYLFVEFPSDHVFPGVKNLFFELMSEGINPIIAHPERNSVFVKNPRFLYDLIQMGAFAQANSASFFGVYGSRSSTALQRFLELNLIHFIASDGHDGRTPGPRLSEASRKAGKIIGEERAGALVRDNPRAVIKNEELPSRPDPINPERKSFSLKIPNVFSRKINIKR